MFYQNIFPNGYVLLGMKNAVLTIIPKVIQRKNQKKLPGRPKKREKVKFLSKIIFQLPTWRQIVQILVQCCKSSAANRTISRPKSVIVSQSQHNVFVNVFLWTRKMHFWQICCKISTKVEKFLLKFHTKLKKKGFWKKNSSKSSRTFRMQLWQIWRNFFSELRFFFARTRS